MNDLSSLLGALDDAQEQQHEAVIATVVKVEGSAYRRPGARMVIAQLGEATGTVSGGCLESDVAKKAWWLTAAGKPTVRSYSTGEDDDELEEAELSFGLGCNGTVHILFERIDPLAPGAVVELLREVRDSGAGGALATIISEHAPGEGVSLGERVALGPASGLQTDMKARWLATAIGQDLQAVLDAQRSAIRCYDLGGLQGGGEVEVLLEYVPAPRRLVIFGAGHDAAPLVSMARVQGWDITVIDARPHFARAQRFPNADRVIPAPLKPLGQLPAMVDGAAVVVMTHSLTQDRHWLGQVLSCDPRYIGQLGPRSRTERLIEELCVQQRESPAMCRLYYPVGLDVGGDTPDSVALSILAEINAVFNEREGGMLKHRQASIHAIDPQLARQPGLKMIG